MVGNPTQEQVLEKIIVLNSMHEKLGNYSRSFGVDTLALLFDSSIDNMLALLHALEKKNEVTITFRTLHGRKTGKNSVMYVNLRK